MPPERRPHDEPDEPQILKTWPAEPLARTPAGQISYELKGPSLNAETLESLISAFRKRELVMGSFGQGEFVCADGTSYSFVCHAETDEESREDGSYLAPDISLRHETGQALDSDRIVQYFTEQAHLNVSYDASRRELLIMDEIRVRDISMPVYVYISLVDRGGDTPSMLVEFGNRPKDESRGSDYNYHGFCGISERDIPAILSGIQVIGNKLLLDCSIFANGKKVTRFESITHNFVTIYDRIDQLDRLRAEQASKYGLTATGELVRIKTPEEILAETLDRVLKITRPLAERQLIELEERFKADIARELKGKKPS